MFTGPIKRTFGSLVLATMLLASCGKSEGPDRTSCLRAGGLEMVWVAGGKFTMGQSPQYPEEGPPIEVSVAGFWIDRHEVTNAQFAAFIKATGYQTVAERILSTEPNPKSEMVQPGSAMFRVPDAEDHRWWRWVQGANWRHPEGEASSIDGQEALPVVHIAYEDAFAYAEWAGKALPTEAQWEYAARGGAASAPEPIGKDGTPQANYYQGSFPERDLALDGFASRAPVGCFPPNGFGLYDMIGNVWEWTSSPAPGDESGELKILKGGSFLCAANYCARYRPDARQFQERGLGTNHIGFRLVDNLKPAGSDLLNRRHSYGRR